jgi:hypothetical protein
MIATTRPSLIAHSSLMSATVTGQKSAKTKLLLAGYVNLICTEERNLLAKQATYHAVEPLVNFFRN